MRLRHLALGLTLLVAGLGSLPPAPAVAQASRPNVLIIVTDDQRAMDTLHVMPRTLQRFAEGGTTYTNAYAATPVCCPARAAIMSGRFAHNNGVQTNAQSQQLAQESTLQAQLQAAGYRTAIVGKYLNGWPIETDPPYFHRWHVLAPQADTYYNNRFNSNGTVSSESDYSTDVIRDRAVTLLENHLGGKDDQPWFLYVAPFAPHHPWQPAERHENADVGTWPGTPSVFEADKSDKPDYVKKANRDLAWANETRTGQLRSLLAVDEMVDALFRTLERENEENTIAFFVSDNGFMWAEHGMGQKNHPYTESIKIPFLARWPGHIPAGQTDGSFVANIDIAPTVYDALGMAPNPLYPLDGQSLLQPVPRAKMLNEAWTSRGSWASIRTPTYQYIEYYGPSGVDVRFREYYDLVEDPYQLTNLLADPTPRNDPFTGPLHQELIDARSCAGQLDPTGCPGVLARPDVPSVCRGAADVGGHHMVGSTVRDRMRGISSRDVACGFDGKDNVHTLGGNDLVRGGDGRDVLWGGAGNDTLVGNGGRDVCRGGPGRDRFRGCERELG